MGIVLQFILLAMGFALLVKGADWFVDGAAGIALRTGIPSLVIGLTIVAMGTSAPEAAVSITASLKGNAGITIGNIVGSNLINILIILGIASVIIPIKVKKSTICVEIPYMLVVTMLLLGLGYTDSKIVLWEGVLLWFAFLLYLGYLFWMAKNGKEEVNDEETEKAKPLWKLFLLIVIGIILIILGSNMAVDSASSIAQKFGMSERFIGLTIVALGTSLPELVTSVTAAIRGEMDLAIGNIVGSNMFNILFVVGTTALITPVVFEPKFVLDTLISAGAGILLLICIFRKQELSRTGGIIMLLMYLVYFMYLIL